MDDKRNGLRVIIPARKSRKGDSGEDARYARQETRLTERAEQDGHVVIETVRDTVSSQTMPWERKNLKKWFTDPALLALWDALYIETDRLSRGTDKQWHDIESFCFDNAKKIITTEGVHFPARDDADRYQWVGLKRRARTYWEDTRDKHAQTREIIRANDAASGLYGFGYITIGEKYHKQVVIDEITGPIAKEVFERMAQGRAAAQIATWLNEVAPIIIRDEDGNEIGRRPWRSKRILDMIRRPHYYTGERGGHAFEPLVSEERWNAANAAAEVRAEKLRDRGRNRVHGYSGLICCECGAVYYRHQSTRNGNPVGGEKYRCSKGRRGYSEERCEFEAPFYVPVNDAIDRLMARVNVPERFVTTTGGDHARQAELSRLREAISKATKAGDMNSVTRLAAEFSEVDARPAEPIKIVKQETGRTYADVWREASIDDRRALLARRDFILNVKGGPDAWHVEFEWQGDLADEWALHKVRTAREVLWDRAWDTEDI